LRSISRFILAVVLLCLTVTSHSTPLAAKFEKIDFRLLYQAAQLANQAYEGRSQILGKYPPKSAWVTTPGKNNVQYVLLQSAKRKVQAIIVRGTIDSVNRKLNLDTQGVKDKKTGILMHRGFKTAADVIYKSVKPRLKANYTTHLVGHSLGGAVAAILGIYFIEDKFKVAGIYTFGQPKFTNLSGAKAYINLPLIRVINQNDTVPLIPDETNKGGSKYAHTGSVINLLSGPYYVRASPKQSVKFSVGVLRRYFVQISVPDHKMKWYLRSIRQKLKGAKQVPFEDRDKYIVRHRAGKFYGDPIKRKSNFNHHY